MFTSLTCSVLCSLHLHFIFVGVSTRKMFSLIFVKEGSQLSDSPPGMKVDNMRSSVLANQTAII